MLGQLALLISIAWSKRYRTRTVIALVMCAALSLGAIIVMAPPSSAPRGSDEVSSQSRRVQGAFRLSPSQLAKLTIQPVTEMRFHSAILTEGKIVADEDHATPIFSPYAGRVTRLFVKPGESVRVGQPLFTVEATDMVQAQNDVISAATTFNKAQSVLNLAQINDTRQRMLYEGKAAPLKEVQNAKAALDAAENDKRSAEVALEAARNRLRILGKSEQEIADFQEKGTIDPSTPIYAPIAGTVVQRKVGPGQYVGSSSSDPVFVIGDLSTVWVIAYVRETDAQLVRDGQSVRFKVLTYPDRDFTATVGHVPSSFDPVTRRLPVRATVENPDRLLRLEMFASVTIATSDDVVSPALPREAVIYEGSTARVWLVKDEAALEGRQIKTGLMTGNMVQILEGLQPGERVVTRGSVFIDRLAGGDGT
jgi:membrane fusion protein, heavy metal efflux system